MQAGGRRFDPVCLHQFAGVEARVGLLEIRQKETQHGNVRLAAETRWSGIMDSVKTIVK